MTRLWYCDQKAPADRVKRPERHAAPAAADQARSGCNEGLGPTPPELRYSSLKVGARKERPKPAPGAKGPPFQTAATPGLGPWHLPAAARRAAGLRESCV